MQKGLVSILTPAYNSENYIKRLLNSVLEQTYHSIEMFVIDDGSKDNTADVIKSYIDRFAAKGYNLHYNFQENQGQSMAINNGLKLLNGEFITWPDSDDWYKTSDAIERLVRALAGTYDEFGFVRCFYEFHTEGGMAAPYIVQYGEINENLLDDAIYARNNFIWAPGGYMVKASCLDTNIPTRSIYTSKHAGQNAQILLPILANTKCITIPEVLYCYLIRQNSHSRGTFAGIEKEALLNKTYIETYTHSIESIPNISTEMKTQYIRYIQNRFGEVILKKIDASHNGTFIRDYLNYTSTLDVFIPTSLRYKGLFSYNQFVLDLYCLVVRFLRKVVYSLHQLHVNIKMLLTHN